MSRRRGTIRLSGEERHELLQDGWTVIVRRVIWPRTWNDQFAALWQTAELRSVVVGGDEIVSLKLSGQHRSSQATESVHVPCPVGQPGDVLAVEGAEERRVRVETVAVGPRVGDELGWMLELRRADGEEVRCPGANLHTGSPEGRIGGSGSASRPLSLAG